MNPPYTKIEELASRQRLDDTTIRRRLNLTYDEHQYLKTGRGRITFELAKKLSVEIGASEKYWTALDQEYLRAGGGK